jgi:hypothetical protein
VKSSARSQAAPAHVSGSSSPSVEHCGLKGPLLYVSCTLFEPGAGADVLIH